LDIPLQKLAGAVTLGWPLWWKEERRVFEYRHTVKNKLYSDVIWHCSKHQDILCGISIRLADIVTMGSKDHEFHYVKSKEADHSGRAV
jgi:hypothetical protein